MWRLDTAFTIDKTGRFTRKSSFRASACVGLLLKEICFPINNSNFIHSVSFRVRRFSQSSVY